MDYYSETARWRKLPVLPRKFCIGITVHTSMFIIAWTFFVAGVIMIIGFCIGFSMNNYYSNEVEDSYLLSVLITFGLSFGVAMDMVLLYSLAKDRLRIQGIWAGILLLRMAFWITIGALIWGRCSRGGRMCFVLTPAALVWSSSIGVFTVAVLITYSHIYYVLYDRWLVKMYEARKKRAGSEGTSV